MTFLRAFGAFWYDFIIGDDWKIAVAVILSLSCLVAVMKTNLLSDHGLAILGGVTILGLFAASLAIDVRKPKSKR